MVAAQAVRMMMMRRKRKRRARRLLVSGGDRAAEAEVLSALVSTGGISSEKEADRNPGRAIGCHSRAADTAMT